MKELAKNIIKALAEVYPEIPISKPDPYDRDSAELTSKPIAAFGKDDQILVFLAAKDSSLVLAEPKLVWFGPHHPKWDPQPRFTIPDDWQIEMIVEERSNLQNEAREIARVRMEKYQTCWHCKRLCIPEQVDSHFDDDRMVCHGCQEQHYGVVH